MASLNPLKLAICALVISGIVSRLGGSQVMIEEVVRGVEQRCSSIDQICIPQQGVFCCRDLVCAIPQPPEVPGPARCRGPRCGQSGASCTRFGGECCPGFFCIFPAPSQGYCARLNR